MKKQITIYVLILLMIAITCDSHDHKMYDKKGKVIPHLYGYREKYVREVLKKIGIDESLYRGPFRNSTGTELHFDPWSSDDKRRLILHLDGRIEIREFPTSDGIYSNDGEFLVRHNDIKMVWEFKNGYAVRIHKHREFGWDKAKQYYFAQIEPNATVVGFMRHPSHTRHISHFIGRVIFSKAESVYLFGYDREKERESPYSNPEIICYVLRVQQSELAIQETIHIPRPSSDYSPFFVEDMSPYSDDVLLCDSKDFPLISKWYLYNLNTRQMMKIGWRTNDYVFFLDGDILKQMEEKHSEQK